MILSVAHAPVVLSEALSALASLHPVLNPPICVTVSVAVFKFEQTLK